MRSLDCGSAESHLDLSETRQTGETLLHCKLSGQASELVIPSQTYEPDQEDYVGGGGGGVGGGVF